MTFAADRREFMRSGLVSGALVALANQVFAQQRDDGAGLPNRQLGKNGPQVSVFGLGGHHIGQLGKRAGDPTAIKLMHRALDEGVTFFDNAWDYHNGYSEELMGQAIADRRDKVFLMTKVCDRDYEGAKRHLDESLRRLQTDVIDLWQFHEMVYDNDPDWVFEKGGIRAAREAVKEGKVRYIGFTGHKDPSIHLKMLNKPQAWTASQMPINACDYFFRSFLQEVVPQCVEQGTGVIAMKTMGGGAGTIPNQTDVTHKECLRFALSQPVSTVVTGMTSDRDLDQALEVGRNFQPLTATEQAAILAKVEEVAADGRHELFKTTKNYDGAYHRTQHGFATR